jgi:hypothetical protein
MMVSSDLIIGLRVETSLHASPIRGLPAILIDLEDEHGEHCRISRTLLDPPALPLAIIVQGSEG